MTRFKVLISVICMVSASALTAQNLIPHQYALGSTGSNDVSRVLQDSFGNYYTFIGVNMFSSSMTTGNLGTFQYGKSFFVVSKHQADHELVWRKAFGGDSIDTFGGAELTEDGIIITCISDSPISGTKTVESNGFVHIWIQKIDFDGNVLWQEGIYTESHVGSTFMHKINNNEFILCSSALAGISGDKTSYGYAEFDGWIIKINGQGNIIWNSAIGTELTDFGFGIAGHFSNNDILVYTISNHDASGAKTENNYGDWNYWLVRVNGQTGAIVWDKTIGSGGLGEGLGNIQLVEDQVIFMSNSKSGASGLRNLPLKGTEDIWFLRMDSNGNIIVQNTIGGGNVESAADIGLVSNDRILATIVSNSNISIDKNENSRGGRDIWLVNLDINGNIINQKTIGGDDNDAGRKIIMLPNGNYLLFGSSKSGVSGEKTVPRLGPLSTDVWVIEIDAVTLNVVNEHQIIHESVLFPNPSSGTIQISFTEPTPLNKAVLYDAQGKIVREQDLTQSLDAHYFINTAGLNSGVYSLSLFGQGFMKTQQVVVE